MSEDSTQRPARQRRIAVWLGWSALAIVGVGLAWIVVTALLARARLNEVRAGATPAAHRAEQWAVRPRARAGPPHRGPHCQRSRADRRPGLVGQRQPAGARHPAADHAHRDGRGRPGGRSGGPGRPGPREPALDRRPGPSRHRRHRRPAHPGAASCTPRRRPRSSRVTTSAPPRRPGCRRCRRPAVRSPPNSASCAVSSRAPIAPFGFCCRCSASTASSGTSSAS